MWSDLLEVSAVIKVVNFFSLLNYHMPLVVSHKRDVDCNLSINTESFN